MSFCPKCGAQTPDDAKFCVECGEKLEHGDIKPIDDSNQQNVYVEDVTFKDMFLKTTGRLNRLRYFKRSFVVGFIVFFISRIISGFIAAAYNSYQANLVSDIMWILSVPVLYSINLRRLHDLNYDNKGAIALAVIQVIGIIQDLCNLMSYDLLIIVSAINLVVSVYMLVMDGTHGPNDYGPDPLNR